MILNNPNPVAFSSPYWSSSRLKMRDDLIIRLHNNPKRQQ